MVRISDTAAKHQSQSSDERGLEEGRSASYRRGRPRCLPIAVEAAVRIGYPFYCIICCVILYGMSRNQAATAAIAHHEKLHIVKETASFKYPAGQAAGVCEPCSCGETFEIIRPCRG